MAPSLLLVNQTYRRILNLKAGLKGITFLPITVGSLMVSVYFIFGYLPLPLPDKGHQPATMMRAWYSQDISAQRLGMGVDYLFH
jgi:hypothetical protein